MHPPGLACTRTLVFRPLVINNAPLLEEHEAHSPEKLVHHAQAPKRDGVRVAEDLQEHLQRELAGSVLLGMKLNVFRFEHSMCSKIFTDNLWPSSHT